MSAKKSVSLKRAAMEARKQRELEMHERMQAAIERQRAALDRLSSGMTVLAAALSEIADGGLDAEAAQQTAEAALKALLPATENVEIQENQDAENTTEENS